MEKQKVFGLEQINVWELMKPVTPWREAFITLNEMKLKLCSITSTYLGNTHFVKVHIFSKETTERELYNDLNYTNYDKYQDDETFTFWGISSYGSWYKFSREEIQVIIDHSILCQQLGINNRAC